MNARIQAWLDQEDARMASMIRQHGWAIEYIAGGVCTAPDCGEHQDDAPPFAYTVGMFGLHHPELLVFGLDAHDSAGLLNTTGDRIANGETLIPGQMLEFGEWDHRVVVEEVPNPGEIVFSANRYYQRPDEHSVPVLQLTYDDELGRFPWDQGHSDPERQPRPGTFRA
ncbi:MAG TPA: DUF4262 domain-containing protein [Acidimicrobiia bacterium]|nr:DUF4262 domain-containing protein [Acidimicrobiia bacterium]